MEQVEQIPFNKLIFETIENCLENHIKNLAKDIAKTLSVDEKPLLQAIRNEKIKVYLYEEEEYKDVYEMRCKAFEKEGAIYSPCKEPIVFHKEFCVKHLTNHSYTRDSIKESEELYLIYGSNKMEYYYDNKKNLYDRNLNLLSGKIDHDERKLTIYKITDS